MSPIALWLEQNISIGAVTQNKILATLAVVITLWLLHQIFLRSFINTMSDARGCYQWQKTSGYIAFVLGGLAYLAGRYSFICDLFWPALGWSGGRLKGTRLRT